ncbi:UDP-N-acetylmuramate--L-alanine ligase [Litorivicinus sp.]|nr:UDP-N-acetylmuramate--L-alanine ligase [Litorivicinus sp.]
MVSRMGRMGRMGRIQRIHFIGIGGVGMSGIAEVLLNQGYQVSGSDIKASPSTNRLAALGSKIHIGHDQAHIKDAEVVVVSSAIDRENPEVAKALEQRIPVIPRAQMLAELMRFKQGIAVSGTHGKTTTTSLAAAVLAESGFDPTYIIGGKLNQADNNARLGDSEYMIAEADESDASFLVLKPMIAIVTNIDTDHMSTYDGDFEKLKQAFVQFLQNLPFYGLVIANSDDLVINEILPTVGRTVITFGLDSQADYRARNVVMDGLETRFRVERPRKDDLEISLSLPGKFNVSNALAIVALSDHLGVDEDALKKALSEFQGVGRRFELAGSILREGERIPVIDDYGHHPRELEVTFDAVRQAYPGKRLISVFQPHRYSRTRDSFDDFVSVLMTADELVLMPVFPAGEQPIVGAESKDLAQMIRRFGRCQPVVEKDFAQIIERVESLLQPNDVILIQGAGSIGQLPNELLKKLNGVQA